MYGATHKGQPSLDINSELDCAIGALAKDRSQTICQKHTRRSTQAQSTVAAASVRTLVDRPASISRL